MVDVILNGSDPYTYPRSELLSQGAGLLMRDLNDISSALTTCTCLKGLLRKGEPYHSLGANLS